MAGMSDLEKYGVPTISPLHAQYAALNKLLSTAKDRGDTAALGMAVSRMLGDKDFAAWIAQDKRIPASISTPAECWMVAQRYMYRILYARDYAGAALLLWGPEVFDPRPRSCRLIFGALRQNALVNAMGGASSSKTYSGVAYALLDWLLDPEWTSILLVGPDSDHLRRNMFGDLVRLHEGSVIPLPGKADTESLSTDKRRGMGFFTVALDRGPAASAKLKGAKTKPRSGSDHPLFGRSSRLRILIDEAQQVPVNAWGMLINAISNKESDEHLKVYCAANPSEEASVYGKNCKPSGGWTAIDSVQETWMSETGWAVVRLNAMLSENVRSRKTIFPRLINYEKVMAIIRAAGGDDQAPEVYTQVYGMFPPTGSKAAVIKPTHVELSRGEWIFSGPTTSYLSFDPAYTGDRPAVAAGRYGMASAWMDYAGEIHKLKHEMPAIQVDSVGVLIRGDTQDMSDQIFVTAKSLGVSAECFGIDRTGIGQGCHDIIRRQWGKAVHGRNAAEPADILGICYSERASETKVLDEDTDVPVNMYDNTASELWYAAGKLFERGVIKMGKGVDKLAFDELVGRRGGRVTGKARKLSVESKDAYKARGNSSPDFADTVTMLIHTIRVREDFAPKAEKTPETPEERVDNSWVPQNVWDAVDVTGGTQVSIDMNRLLDSRD